jgi:hypothetical protein
MEASSVCTRCGHPWTEIDGQKTHTTTDGQPAEVKGCPEPVAGRSPRGGLRRVHSGTVGGKAVDVFIPTGD